ncbi:fumarate hydratase [Oceanimonas doudoroffii]|uniref:Fumarate hydratase n=1 Tax=Oceanimonas doudoroffii TaxID=84158 RepID=A0A233REA0_9GAMM|nr:fumarate hydratase [Oceanimonas doudoroffii]OXY81718.1 fumarate hydratase [Oceanimonas doudoroffii]
MSAKRIPQQLVLETATALMARAAIDIPPDYKQALQQAASQETENLSCFVIKTMLENYDVAEKDRRPMCADTGLPRFYVKAGNEAMVEGGFVALEHAVREAVVRGTQEIPLRPNRVHPLTRKDNNNNLGIHAPEIEYTFEPGGDWIDLITVHKGGLFGTDYRMLFPGDGIDGIKRFFLDTMASFGRRGLACQPAIIGVGLGGNKDTCMRIGKEAACLRVVGDVNPDPEVARLEQELKELGNSIGMGPMGFKGNTLVVDCHVEVAYTHTGGMPMSIHSFCHSSRRAAARIYSDGRVEFRDDPQWFTDFYRREGI